MLNTVLSQVTQGATVAGRYKRGTRPAVEVSMTVDRVFVVPDQFGNETPYVLGTYNTGPRTGTVAALRADCFDPRTLELGQEKDYKPLPTDGSEWYLTTGSGAFGFTERVSEDDIDWAVVQGGTPLSDYECNEISVSVAAAA